MGQGKRLARRGVVRRNAKLQAMRELVSRDRMILAVDLASQRQAAVVCDHDSVVLARRMFTGSAWGISEILAWAGPVAGKAGFAGLVLACEPTGHRWKPLVVTASDRETAGDEWRGGGYVFATGWGDPVHPDTVSSLVTDLIRLHNRSVPAEEPERLLPPAAWSAACSCHHAAAGRVPVHVVAARPGHADPSVTLRVYARM